MGIYGNSIQMASKSLDYLWKKESVISNNLANVETVGYKTKYVTFEDEFKQKLDNAMQIGNRDDIQQAINNSNYQIHETSPLESTRQDGNNVNADVEMIELTKTSLQYQYLLSSLNGDITRFNTVIRGQ